MIMKNKSEISIIEWLIVLLAAAALVLGVTIGLGTMFSGWHLVDDHQFFQYIYRMKYQGQSLLDVIISELKRDYYSQHRARLLFYPLRVPQAYLFGLDSRLYEILKAVEAIIALVMLYFSARELSLSRCASALFSLTSFCGPQSAVWWKLGTPQLQATMFFAVGFYFMVRYLKYQGKTNSIISIFFYVLMANCHESYIVFIPFLILFVIYYGYKEAGDGVKVSVKTIWEMAAKRLGYVIALCLIFASLMVYIVFFLGVNEYGSVEVGMPLSEGIANWTGSLIEGDLKFYWWFGIVLVILLATFYEKVKKLWMEMIMFAVIIIPQLLLYEKEGFYERYLLPLVVGWALFFVVAVYGNEVLSGKRKLAYTAVLFAMTLLLIRGVVIEADYYRFRGESVTAMLGEALEVENEGMVVANALGIANPEADQTVQCWLLANGQKDSLYWNENVGQLKEITQTASKSEASQSHDMSEVDLFIAYNRNDRHFTIDPSVDLSAYNYVRCGSIDLFYSDRAYSALTQDRLDAMKVKPTIYGIGED